jgi:hypothetical protein
MQPVDDAAFNSLCAMLRNLVQQVHGHAGPDNPSKRELADAIAPLLYQDAARLLQRELLLDLRRIILNMPLKVLGRLLRIAYNLGIIRPPNGTDMCSRIASNVSTIGTPRPTTKGLLKAFARRKGEPAHEYIEADQKVRALCVRVIEYIDNAEKN